MEAAKAQVTVVSLCSTPSLLSWPELPFGEAQSTVNADTFNVCCLPSCYSNRANVVYV